MTYPTLTIANTAIRQDTHGRYCLNDLHKAAGGNQKHQPRYWLANQQTKDLIAELKTDSGIPLSVLKGGSGMQGTYVVKELVYAYAMWISAKFHLAVIRAYDALVSQPSIHQLLSDPASLDALAERIAQRLPGNAAPYGVPRPWTPEEDTEADRLRALGYGATRTGFALRRTADSVKHRFKLRAQRTAQLLA